jgi:uncharacterized protein YdeI (YjbR/CyaY-like superfamily)
MGKNSDSRVDAYIAKSAAFAQPILRHLRTLVHQACPEACETIKWGMPSFEYHGILCGMAAFKEHCTFGFWHHGMQKILGADGRKADQAMGAFGRIASLADLPSDKDMIRYIKAAGKLNESGAPARTPPKPKRGLPVPPDLKRALAKNKAAAAAFEKFSPSHRREYIAWITEAKRDETREKRLLTTVEWLSDGKSFNWKYERG